MDRTNFICYDKDENGRFVINLQQAETVKFIYEKFLEGDSPESIAKYLNENDIAGWTGNANWYPAPFRKCFKMKSTRVMPYCKRPLRLIF